MTPTQCPKSHLVGNPRWSMVATLGVRGPGDWKKASRSVFGRFQLLVASQVRSWSQKS